ncbi:DUF262 domain-containing protein [Rummeliibacillus suwonensis]|uniref:DUF262 domain-containing protein n=1 Tax=Rummeliibacillus suwonensis TaxID=1306154 RepID=UPI0011B7FE25|nr:DUF262 domain-containing protein [Rummeliibacillus suwonensis]
MKANETNLQEIIEGSKQYIIPMFQRTYSWELKQWQTLWEDLMELVDDNDYENHFIGSIVSIPVNANPTGVQQFLTIDGQQRLTTLLILMSALRDRAKEHGNDELSSEIHETMLVNRFKKGEEFFKLLPTQVDKEVFKKIIKNENLQEFADFNLVKAYDFFIKQLSKTQIELEKFKNVVLHSLSIVSIVLSTDDNPYLVFESLNAKGQPLTEADLIRNYLFMRIHPDEQEEMYKGYWLPMQNNLQGHLTEFIRHYLIGINLNVKKKDVYVKLKEQADKLDVVEYLKKLSIFASYYDKLLHPQKESHISIRTYLERILKIEATTAYPFLLYIYNDYDRGKYSVDQFCSILAIIDNFLVRRFVCSIDSKSLNKLFGSLYNQLKSYNAEESIKQLKMFLQVRGYPKDSEVEQDLAKIALYGQGDKRDKCKFILSVLEEGFGHKEKVNLEDTTIEHIMPQTLNDYWRDELGANAEQTHETLLHVIGNLTLTSYNSQLSNEPFLTKKKYYEKSNIELNKQIAQNDKWNEQAIRNRTLKMTKHFLKVWPYFGLDNIVNNDVTGSSPRLLSINNQHFKVKTWREVLEYSLMYLYKKNQKYYSKLLKTHSSMLSVEKTNNMRSPKQLENGHYVEMNLSAKSINAFCIKSFNEAGYSLEQWHVEVEVK